MTPGPLTFEITTRSKSCDARAGLITTPHGSFHTPAFMPVGTKGAMKGILPAQLRQIGAEVCLNNTYHLLMRPGPELVARRGGVHPFMCWDGPILTDSGGYQAYSMADINTIDENGVTFKSVVSGDLLRLTPEEATRVQNQLGADIIMAFDDCPPSVDPDTAPVNQTRLRHATLRDTKGDKAYDHEARLDLALERTTRWLGRCLEAHARPSDQALFGIVQGGTDPDRRRRSAEQITALDCPGYAIGGVAVGESAGDIANITRLTAPLLPSDKPRYLMGVGYERDIVAAVCAGIDMFDCVLPARNGRNANAFIQNPEFEPEPEGGGERRGQIRLKNARFAEDDAPLEPGCDCPACDPASAGWPSPGGGPFTRAYLRHLFLAGEMVGPILVSLHNLRHFQRLMMDLRAAIANDDWPGFARAWPRGAAGLPSELGPVAGV
ncbi:MAG: tRNA guanosine(34) transglycosylase Tgt [Planctomycetota bacterium]